MPVDYNNPNHVRPDGTLTHMGECAARVPPPKTWPPGTYMQSPKAGTAPLPPVPSVPPVYYKQLSLDAMIGICFLLFVFALGGYSVNFVLWVGGIALTIWAWRKLYSVAPVTAQIILIVFIVLISALISLGNSGGGSGR